MDDGPQAPRRRGRRPGPNRTGEAIEQAARELFTERGYANVSVRDIAARADVNHALVLQRFGSKEQLFVATFRWPFNPEDFVDQVLADGTDEIGRRVVAGFVQVWDRASGRNEILALVRRASEQESAAQMLREFVASRLLVPLVQALPITLTVDQQQERAGLLAVQLMGLAMTRYVLCIEPISTWPPEEVVEAVGPLLDAILTAPAHVRA